MRYIIQIFLVIISCNTVLANETLPHFFSLGSTTNNSVLSMQCEGEKPFEVIYCIFSEIDIRQPVNEQVLYVIISLQKQCTENQHRWNSNLNGGGMRTIENDPANIVLWKYTEITNDTPSKILTYSWDSPSEYSIERLGCKNIKFLGVNKNTLGTGQIENKK